MKSAPPSPRLPFPPSFAAALSVQVKICGITTPTDADFCVRAGADAIGLVFHPRSARFVRLEQAMEIARAVPDGFPLVGVFVDMAESVIRRTAETAGLSAVQLHGAEIPTLVADLRRSGLRVIKALFTDRPPGLAEAIRYQADAFLVEPGRGPLPGGSGEAWAWTVPAGFCAGAPLVLAGGLHPGNVRDAIRSVRPDAVDVSTGVESAPGWKDPERVQAFMEAVRSGPTNSLRRRIF